MTSAPTATAISVLPMSSVLRTTRTPITRPRMTSTDEDQRDDVVPAPQLIERDEQARAESDGQKRLQHNRLRRTSCCPTRDQVCGSSESPYVGVVLFLGDVVDVVIASAGT